MKDEIWYPLAEKIFELFERLEELESSFYREKHFVRTKISQIEMELFALKAREIAKDAKSNKIKENP